MIHKSGCLLSHNPVSENVYVKVDKNMHLYHVKYNQHGEMSDAFILVQTQPDQGSSGCLLKSVEKHDG